MPGRRTALALIAFCLAQTAGWSCSTDAEPDACDVSNLADPNRCGAAIPQPGTEPQGLAINEVVALNAEHLDPDFGASGDWVELYNVGTEMVVLAGYGVSDDRDEPFKWRFPPGATLEPGAFVLVWCDGRDVAPGDALPDGEVAAAFHAGFRLSAAGEAVVLTGGSGAREDQLSFVNFGLGTSLARFPDGIGSFSETAVPTPGAPNVIEPPAHPPLLAPSGGRFEGPVVVTMSTCKCAEIRYTTDGSVPTKKSPLYTAEVTLEASAALRAVAFYDDGRVSPMAVGAYFISPATTLPIIDLALPPADLFDDKTGIHANPLEHGDEWERYAHVSVIPAAGGPALESGAGLRVHGRWSRNYPKLSFRLHMRNEYGASSWSLPMFERTLDPAFDGAVLHSGSQDSFNTPTAGTYTRDELTRILHASMGYRAADGFYAALYLNGEYWGLYNVTERITEALLNEPDEAASWDILQGTPAYIGGGREVVDGDAEAWDAFLAFVDAHDFATEPDACEELLARIDLDNLVDYFILNIYSQNHDWPDLNWYVVRRKNVETARWRLWSWDAEFGFGWKPTGHTADSLANAIDPPKWRKHGEGVAPLARVFQAVLAADEGRDRFIGRAEEALNFELSPAAVGHHLEALLAHTEGEIGAERERWAAATERTPEELAALYAEHVEMQRTFVQERPAIVRQHIVAQFGLAGFQRIVLLARGAGIGHVEVNGRPVALPWSGVYFAGSEVRLVAVPEGDASFSGWGGAIDSHEGNVTLTADTSGDLEIEVEFEEEE